MVRPGHEVVIVAAMVAGVTGVVTLDRPGDLRVRLDRLVVVQSSAEPAWRERLALVDEALDRAELNRAVYEWRKAYDAAVRTRRWKPLVEVGDRAMRVSRVAGRFKLFRSEACQTYLHALSRARAVRSAEGVERIAEAFERLGDSERARQARRIAESLS